MLHFLFLYAKVVKKPSQDPVAKVDEKPNQDPNKQALSKEFTKYVSERSNKSTADWKYFLEAVKGIFSNSNALLAKEAEARSVYQKVPQAKAAFMPKVDAFYQYGTENHGNREPIDKSSSDQYNKESVGVQMGWNLFNGGKDLNALNAIDASARRAFLEYFAQLQDDIYSVIEFIGKIQAAKKNIEFLDSSEKNKSRLLQDANAKVREGTALASDVAQAQAELARVSIEKNNAEIDIEKEASDFQARTGMIYTHAVMLPLPDDMPKTLEEAEKLALKNNINLKVVQSKIAEADFEKNAARSEFFPKVSVNGQMSQDRIRGSQDRNDTETYDLGGGLAGIKPRKVNSNGRFVNSSINLRVEQSIWNGFKDMAAYKEASHTTIKSRKDLEETKAKIIAELRTLWKRYAKSLEDIKSHRQAVSSGKITYDTMFTKYKEGGEKTMSDALDAEAKWQQALKAEADNEKTLILTAWRIKLLIGELTPTKIGLGSGFNPFKGSRI